jgi:hypothetical protein
MGQPVIVDLAILAVVVACYVRIGQHAVNMLKLANSVVKLSEALQIMINTQNGIIQEMRRRNGQWN